MEPLVVKRDIQKVIERSQPSMLLLHACEKSFNHSTSTKAYALDGKLLEFSARWFLRRVCMPLSSGPKRAEASLTKRRFR